MPGPHYHRSPSILSASVGEAMLLLDRHGGESFELNAVAGSLWRHLDQPRDFCALEELIHAEFAVEPAECAPAVRELIAEFEAGGLICQTDAVEGPRPPERRPDRPRQPVRRSQVSVSRELGLCIDCCAGNFGGADVEPIDWQRVLRLARFHRVEALVWDQLSHSQTALPREIADEFSNDASRIVLDNLRAAAASDDLRDAFAAANIEVLFLKGLTLASLAYQNPTLKSSIDIDLLIDPADLGPSARILRDAGFVLTAPSDSARDVILHAWHQGWKESVWARGALQVDLHTRTADHPRLIPSISVHSARQTVDIGNGIVLPTLACDELFAYLAVHGASSAWFRLKWIGDLAAFLGDPDAAELDRLYRRSQQFGAGRAAGQALLLTDDLFGNLEPNPSLRAELRADNAIVKLERAALRLLTSEPIEPTERRFGTLPIHRTQLSLLPGIGFALSELARQVKQKLISRG